MRLVVLEGSWEEIGRRFAQLISQEGEESLRYLLNGSRRVSLHIHQGNSPVQRLTASLLELLVMIKGTRPGEDVAQLTRGMGQVKGISPRRLAGYLASPDIFNYLLSKADNTSRRGIPAVFLGCSSVVALPDATSTGAMYHARNLDYIGGRYWEKGHCIQVIRPKGGLASVNVATDGILCPGITSVNEEGISLSLHLNFTKDVRFKNTPITYTAMRIITKARTLGEAVDMARGSNPMAGWTFIIASHKEEDAAIVELSARRSAVIYPENGLLWYTNMYVSEIMREKEYAPSYIWVENNNTRYNRLKELLLQKAGRLNPQEIVKIMGDTYDATVGREVSLGHTVSNAANISSALISLKEDSIWVSDSPVPANRGVFKGYRLSALFEGRMEELEGLEGHRLPDNKEEAFRLFTLGCFIWEEEASITKTLSYVEQAIQRDPEEPLFSFVKALLLAKAGELQTAISILEETADNPMLNGTRRAQVLFWLGRLMDAAGRREEAIEAYRRVLVMRAPLDMQKKAAEHLEKPYSTKKLRKVDLLPFIADTIDQ